MEMWAELNLPPEDVRGESEESAALSDDAAAFADWLVSELGIDHHQAVFVNSRMFLIGGLTGEALMLHGQRMKSPDDFSAHLKTDGLGGYWLDVSAAFKGDPEGATLAARRWRENVGELNGIGHIDYVRLRGTDGTAVDL